MENQQFNIFSFWIEEIMKYQNFLLSGMNIFQCQSAQFTNKREDSYDVDWPKDLYIDGEV